MGMPYNQGPPPQGGQGGWGQPPQGQQGGWQQPPGQGYQGQQGGWGGQQQGQQGYAPFGQDQGGYAGQSSSPGGYDFGYLFGQADMSSNLLDKGQYDGLVEEATWDRTKDGTKSAWTIVFRTTSGQHPDTKLTMTLAVNEFKKDGQKNPAGLGIMYRQLAAMGIPVPPFTQQGFWELGWTPEQVAQAMVGRPVLLSVGQSEWEGVTRNKVADIRPPRPGASLQRVQPQQQPQGQQGGAPFGGPPQGWQPQAPGQAPQPWQQPQGAPQGQQFDPYTQQGQGPGQPYQGQQGPPPGQQPGGWQTAQGQGFQQGYQQQQGTPYEQWQQGQGQGQQAPQGPPQGQQGPPPGWQPNMAAPPHAQPHHPGQGGTGQFTQQGQGFQPGTIPEHTDQAAQWMQQGQPPFGGGAPNGGQYQQGPPPQGQQAQGPQQGQEGPPQPPGWAR